MGLIDFYNVFAAKDLDKDANQRKLVYLLEQKDYFKDISDFNSFVRLRKDHL